MSSSGSIAESHGHVYTAEHDSQANSMKRSWSTDSLSCNPAAKSCVCSPTKHVGSFRCRLHRSSLNQQQNAVAAPPAYPKGSTSLKAIEAE
uniref:Uncharacterized protein n=1 Tax=Nelumbo nucifera TaxID=4432 RepID=A0A822ZIJ6_NELNU|nr:TPA_asm: hypothetical protein HUJ06_001419 [Nelumbo nucifera]